jgi:hypothetical protein
MSAESFRGYPSTFTQPPLPMQHQTRLYKEDTNQRPAAVLSFVGTRAAATGCMPSPERTCPPSSATSEISHRPPMQAVQSPAMPQAAPASEWAPPISATVSDTPTSQVSLPPHKKSRPYSHHFYPAPTVPEVVRIQRSVLNDGFDDDPTDVDRWSMAHVLEECIHPTTKEQTLRLHYENGDEETVCEGAV